MGSSANDVQLKKLKILHNSLKELTDILPHLNDDEGVIIAKSIDKLVEAIISIK